MIRAQGSGWRSKRPLRIRDLILLRLAHRITSTEVTANEFCRTEFRGRKGVLDLEPSVYEIDETQITQIVAESHAVAPDKGRPTTKPHFNVKGLEPRAPVSTPGEDSFALLQSAHREIHFEDKEELRHFAARLLKEIEERKRTVERGDVQRFVAERNKAGDSEWQRFLAETPVWKDWVELVE